MSEERPPAKSKAPAYLLGALAGVASWVIAILGRISSAYSLFITQRLHLPFLFLPALTGLPLLLLVLGVVMAVVSAKRREPRASAFYVALVLGVVVTPLLAIGLCFVAFSNVKL